jgi:hypothetical protein
MNALLSKRGYLHPGQAHRDMLGAFTFTNCRLCGVVTSTLCPNQIEVREFAPPAGDLALIVTRGQSDAYTDNMFDSLLTFCLCSLGCMKVTFFDWQVLEANGCLSTRRCRLDCKLLESPNSVQGCGLV